MKRIAISCLFLFSFFAPGLVQAQTPQVLTLKQCVETAISNNLTVRQAGYQAESDKVNYQQAKNNQLPYIGGSVNHGINQGRSIDPYTNTYADQQINFASYNINTSVVIWNGSAIRNNIRQNELTAKASELDWQQAKENITINVILAYLQILNNQEQLTIAKKQVEVSRNQVDRLSILDAAGAVAPSDLYDLRALLAGDELNVQTIRNTLENAKISLAQLMNVQYNTNLQLENIGDQVNPVIYDGTPDNIYTAASQQLAFVRAADLRYQSAGRRVLSAKGRLLPVLSFTGYLGSNYSSVANSLDLINVVDVPTSNYINVSGTKYPVFTPQSNYQSHQITYGSQLSNNFNSQVALGLQIPILNSLIARNNIKQAKIVEKRTAFEAQSARTQLRQSIDQSYVNMNSAFEKYQTLSRQLNDFTASFKAAEVRFNAGVKSSVEYLLAKNNMDRANSNFISAKYDYLLRSKVLDFYQGKPLW